MENYCKSHGIPYNIQKKVEDLDLELIDCTCPFVKSVHRKVEEYNNNGYKIIIIGDREHPEVIGINGWCNNEGIIVNNEEEARKIPYYDKICIVSQTTNTLEKFECLSNILNNRVVRLRYLIPYVMQQI